MHGSAALPGDVQTRSRAYHFADWYRHLSELFTTAVCSASLSCRESFAERPMAAICCVVSCCVRRGVVVVQRISTELLCCVFLAAIINWACQRSTSAYAGPVATCCFASFHGVLLSEMANFGSRLHLRLQLDTASFRHCTATRASAADDALGCHWAIDREAAKHVPGILPPVLPNPALTAKFCWGRSGVFVITGYPTMGEKEGSIGPNVGAASFLR